MANIFLSYAREDIKAAKRLAEDLSHHGHKVWWDRHLTTGARFTAEIDRVLQEAEAVVVIWSRSSIESAWVQDEAAVGRDKGRLFPVLIEPVQPPLGFRQYESADFTHWSGRRRDRAFVRLEQALSLLDQPGAPSQPAGRSLRWQAPHLIRASVISLLLVAVVATAWWSLRSSGKSTLGITASSADGRSQDFAREVAVDFTRLQPADLGELVIRGGSKADYQAQLGMVDQGPTTRVDLSLRLPRHGNVTWADSIEMPRDRPSDLRQQMTAALANALRCVLYAEKSSVRLSTSDFRLFLDGCAAISSEYATVTSGDQVPIFRKVAANNPDFAPAQALLALALYQVIVSSSQAQVGPLVAEARRALDQARRIDPNHEDVFAAESLLHSADREQWDHAFPILDRGLAKHPDSAILLGLRSVRLLQVGRMDEATENARQALQLDPVTPQTRVNYINALAYSGRYGGARDELDKAEAIWPNSEVLKDARYRLDLRYGDPHRALVTLDQGMTGDGGSATESWRKFLLARIDPALANVEAALKAFRERYRHDPGDIPGYIQALGTFGKVDEAFLVSRNPVTLDSMMASTETLFRPQMRSIYSDPRFIELADRLGLLAYWRKSRVWPDFCSDPAIRYNCRREANKLLEQRRAASR